MWAELCEMALTGVMGGGWEVRGGIRGGVFVHSSDGKHSRQP